MKTAEKILSQEVENKNHPTVSTDQKLSQIKNKLEKENLRAIPVIEKKELKGAIGYRDLIRHLRFNTNQTKLKEVMHSPPKYESGDNLFDLINLRINSGRKMLVRVKDKKLKAVISDKEFLETLKQTKELEQISSKRAAVRDIQTVFEEDKIEEARHIMMDHDISRLPVLDKNGNLTGIIKSTDIMKTLIQKERPDWSGAQGSSPKVNVSGGEKESMSKIPVKEIIDRTPPTHEGHLSGTKVIKEMERRNSHELIIVDENYPKAIITVKDLLSSIETFQPRDTMLVNLTGIDLPEEKAAIHEKIRKSIQGSLGRKLKQPEELNIRIKKSDKEGQRHRYEFNITLFSELGQTRIEEDGWELLDTLDQALDELNKVVRNEREKRKEKR